VRCDSHVHIVGDTAVWPQARERTYLAGSAPLDTLRAQAAARGVERFVIVQPSFYGDDNGLLLATLDALAGRGRGVAVIDPDHVGDSALLDMAARGVRGLRLNLYSPGEADPAANNARLRRLIDRAAAMNWHVEVIAPLDELAPMADLLRAAPTPVVLDHYGLPGDHAPDSPTAAALLGLMDLPHVWMKLSSPYRMGRDPLAIAPHRGWLAALTSVAPDRCVWGSDWPHTPAHGDQKGPDVGAAYRPLSYAALVDEFETAVASPALFHAIMVDNPARLYEFD
jgi:predicted TIM-barrel fold metal-dependent hydrolase